MELPSPPSSRRDGKRPLVAGASSSIGLACGVALGKVGADNTVATRRSDALVEAMTKAGMTARPLSMDVTDVPAKQAYIAENGPFDILVNSAGLARHGPPESTTKQDFDGVAAFNFKAVYFLCQAVAKKLLAAGKAGSLITIGSQMAKVGGLDRAVYASTNHAVEGFTKSMAIDWGRHGIRVNSICPTFIETPLTQQTFERPQRRTWVEEKIKFGRIGKVEGIMVAVQFLSSIASALVTGAALMVDGGWTAD